MIVENHLLGLVKLAIQHANRSNLVNPTGKALSLEAILVAILRSVVPSPDVAAGVADSLPSSNNLRLDELTLVLQQQAIIHYRRKTERAAERLAHALKKLSVKQHDLGELQEAQSSAREAAEILAGLMGPPVAAPPSDLNRRLKLAAARANLANILCSLNTPDAAVEQVELAEGLIGEVRPIDLDARQIGQVQVAVLQSLQSPPTCRTAMGGIQLVEKGRSAGREPLSS